MTEAEGQVEVPQELEVVDKVIPRENDLVGTKKLDQALEEYEKKLEAVEAQAGLSTEQRAEQGQGESATGGTGTSPGPSRVSRSREVEEKIDHIQRIKAMTKTLTAMMPQWDQGDENRFQRACKSVEQELKELQLGRGPRQVVEEEDDGEEEEVASQE